MKWRKGGGYGQKCYQAKLSHEQGMVGINLYIYKSNDKYYFFAHGSMAVVFHKRLKKATNFKEAAYYSQKRLVRILESWIDLLN